MDPKPIMNRIDSSLKRIGAMRFGPFDLLPRGTTAEKIIDLVLSGVPNGPVPMVEPLEDLRRTINCIDTSGLKVVVLGGGTGLSNVIGGDSRNPAWPLNPFYGLKEIFPDTTSIVCVTDDGGSSGEMLKDLPTIALGDIRHVLLSSVQKTHLAGTYNLNDQKCRNVAATLFELFNYRFKNPPRSFEQLMNDSGADLSQLPHAMTLRLREILEAVFNDSFLIELLKRPHCLGNIIIVSSIIRQARHDKLAHFDCAALRRHFSTDNILAGIREIADIIGAAENCVLPCTTTPATLKMLYANGVLVTGEHKSSRARRVFPVDRVFVEFADTPEVPTPVTESIAEADIILFAPGSLFSSIIPILQTPGIADAIRSNSRALKVLISNLWVQKGETDIVSGDPRRRYYVSDIINAYHRNIPGGLENLFDHVLVLGLHDIPGSILQQYALEEKHPIYLDRDCVRERGFDPIECNIFSQAAMRNTGFVQHDPAALAGTVRVLWSLREHLNERIEDKQPAVGGADSFLMHRKGETLCLRYKTLKKRLRQLTLEPEPAERILEILWRHQDIPVCHLDYLKGVVIVESKAWSRSEEWDKKNSFFDPYDRFIKIRHDIVDDPHKFEVAFLIALGQSLLGDYAKEKGTYPVYNDREMIGKVYKMNLREPGKTTCYFDHEEVDHYLGLVRMERSAADPLQYTRLVTGQEGFTPPGLLFGLLYVWYLDNRFASHVEYKMAILRMELSDLVYEQKKISRRRKKLIEFFRKVVFRHDAELYDRNYI